MKPDEVTVLYIHDRHVNFGHSVLKLRAQLAKTAKAAIDVECACNELAVSKICAASPHAEAEMIRIALLCVTAA